MEHSADLTIDAKGQKCPMPVLLASRGISLGSPPLDPYAKELRQAAHDTTKGQRAPEVVGSLVLVDRLLIGALIEARSCERFKLIVDALDPNAQPEMHAFYTELFACEARHYRVYVDLAKSVIPEKASDVDERLAVLAQAEGRIVARLAAEEGSRAMVHG